MLHCCHGWRLDGSVINLPKEGKVMKLLISVVTLVPRHGPANLHFNGDLRVSRQDPDGHGPCTVNGLQCAM